MARRKEAPDEIASPSLPSDSLRPRQSGSPNRDTDENRTDRTAAVVDPKAKFLIQTAADLRRKRAPDELRAALDELAAIRPDEPLLHFRRGELHVSAGKHYAPRRAQEALQRFLSLTKDEANDQDLLWFRDDAEHYLELLRRGQRAFVVTPRSTLEKIVAQCAAEVSHLTLEVRKAEAAIGACEEYIRGIRQAERETGVPYNGPDIRTKNSEIGKLNTKAVRGRERIRVLRLEMSRAKRALLGAEFARTAGSELLEPMRHEVFCPRLDRGTRVGPEVARAIQLGLRWLVKHQDRDGRGDSDGFMKHDPDRSVTGAGRAVHDVGCTALATLALLAEGNTIRGGQHADAVRNAVYWLVGQQSRSGVFGTMRSEAFIYDHVIATCAVSEAYGLSDERALHDNVKRAIDYLETHRNSGSGWRYDARGGASDASVTAWCVTAYASARMFGIPIKDAWLADAMRFLDGVTDPATGRSGYRIRGDRSSRYGEQHAERFPVEKTEALTAATLVCRQLLGQRSQTMDHATQRLIERPPIWDGTGGVDVYYWYHASHALFQVGGNAFAAWNRDLHAAVLGNQRRGGHLDGSWDPVGAWGSIGGRVYATAMITLALQAPYRFGRVPPTAK
ncbi:MAG: hypothetical protein KDC87_15700 [Planctomycetes bacterium]|nr:hypothetical protein [Planctomycetota bacterium]